MRRLLVLVLLISLGLNVGLALRLRQAPAPAERAWPERGSRMAPAPGDTQAWRERMDRRFARLCTRLGLDQEQKVAFRRHREQVEQDVRARTAELEACRAALRSEAGRRPPDPAAVTAALAAAGRAEAALDSLVAVNLKTELELLRPDQQELLLQMLPFDRLGTGGYGRGRGAGGGPGHGHRHGGQGGSERPVGGE